MQSTHNLNQQDLPELDEPQDDTVDDAMALVLRVNERVRKAGETPSHGVPQVA